MNLEKMRNTCERMQWSLDDIDWDAPGKPQPHEARRFAKFLTNVSWIEYIAGPAFPLLADAAHDENLSQIYLSFGQDEMRHALAERRIMERWGVIRPGEEPTPSPSIRTMREFSENRLGQAHPALVAALIPFLEIQLDGSLIPHLSAEVTDPVFHEVFAKINKDESRHLAVNFHMLGHVEKEDLLTHMGRFLRISTDMHVLYALFFGFLPFIGRTMNDLISTGLDYKRVHTMLDKYIDLGKNDPAIAANPSYRVVAKYAELLKIGNFRVEGYFADLSEAIDKFGHRASNLTAMLQPAAAKS